MTEPKQPRRPAWSEKPLRLQAQGELPCECLACARAKGITPDASTKGVEVLGEQPIDRRRL